MGGVPDKYHRAAEGLNRSLYMVMLCTDNMKTNAVSPDTPPLTASPSASLGSQSILLS